MWKKTSIVLVSIVLMLNVFTLGEHSGYIKGMYEALKDTSPFSIAPGSYGYLKSQYSYIIWLGCAFLAGKIIKKELFSQPVCLLALIGILFVHWNIYLEKNYLADLNQAHFFETVAYQTKIFDSLCVLLVVVLIIIQIIIPLTYYLKNRKTI